MITNTQIERDRQKMLLTNGLELPDITRDILVNLTNAFERLVTGAEALYAVRTELNQAWLDHMRDCWQLIVTNQFNIANGGRERSQTILAALTDDSIDAPDPILEYMIELDDEDEDITF